ncbi:MAG: peptidoglycan-binding domain-containing protein [Pseudolabrys sp.]
MPKRTKRSAKAQPERPSTGALALAVLMHYPRQSVATFMSVLAVGMIVSNALFMQAGQHPAPIFGRKPQGVTVQVAEPPAPRPRIIAAAPAAQNNAVPMMVPAPVAAPAAIPVPVPAPAPAAAPRNRGDIITDLQRELSHKGFYDGAVDGIWGAKTDMALRDFANAAGIRLTPDATEDVLRTVTKSSVVARKHETTGRRDRAGDPIGDLISTPKPPAEIPAVAAPVQPSAAAAPQGSNRLMAVQRALTDFGYGQIKPTGAMGPETQAAIERFERDRKLPVTGKLSDQMLRELGTVTGRTIE